MSTTIRVSDETHERFARLAEATGRPMTQLLNDAADALERRLFFDEMSSRWDALRNDDKAWRVIKQERAAEDGSVADSSK